MRAEHWLADMEVTELTRITAKRHLDSIMPSWINGMDKCYGVATVSYTHLDVYKRQHVDCPLLS